MSVSANTASPSPWSFHEKHGDENPDCKCSAYWRHYQHNGKRNTPNGLEILSVTQALGIIDKSGALTGWTENVTCEAAWRMDKQRASVAITAPIIEGLRAAAVIQAAKGNAAGAQKLRRRAKKIETDGRYSMPPHWRNFQQEMRFAGLDRNSVMTDAQDRGTATHKCLEDWIDYGKIPKLKDYPVEWHGWIRALAGWLSDERPEFLESEIIVGSATHGFAGRRDTVCRVRDKKRGNALLDAKTSKAVYPSSMFRQLGAYEIGGVESGEEPTDAQGILRLAEDGSWEIKWVQDVAPIESFQRAFLRALATCRDERAIEKADKAAKKRAKA